MKQSHCLNSEILKACDIRGIVERELNERDAYFIGRSYGTVLARKKLKRCVLGYDGRLSSLNLSESFIRGLIESGIHVINLGLVPTPLVYFALYHLNADAAVIVTASHNPPEYNGFKVLTQEGPFHGETLRKLGVLCSQGDFTEAEGRLESMNLINEYITYLGTFVDDPPGGQPGMKGLSVVWDPGNGAAAAVLAPFLASLPGHHTSICDEVDGRFPHHHPDPSLEQNMMHLRDAVAKTGADLGIAFDGDGDRIGVVDSE
ncbi:MAG: phosphomannomutase/phosphoglucomutase, partial [Oceanispirochaeta sp.]|nr:phosphomannomutase/phosphoglucomutase [Oceanispirochaeta sp.]